MDRARYCLCATLALWSTTAAVQPVRDNIVAADSPLVRWVGRTAAPGSGRVFFDWEGVSASLSLTNFSYLVANIFDDCVGTGVGGGSRWLVTMDTANPNTASPSHRVSVFMTGPIVRLYYLFSVPGARCDPACDFGGTTTFTLTRLTESRLSGCGPGGNLSVVSFSSDGMFVSPPAAPGRRLEFVGDSITAGDLNDGQSGDVVCGNAAFNNDITYSTGGRLCLPISLGGFGADCMFSAWGGIRLGVGADWGMSKLYPNTFSAGGEDAYGAWEATAFPADGVVINLGTNDRPASPALAWQAAYAAFVTDVVARYKRASFPVFLAYGPMTSEYEPFVKNITATLVTAGVNAHALDLTLTHPMTGCYGHPSLADNVEIAAKARPQIAAVLGW
jgi:hypothetical protein